MKGLFNNLFGGKGIVSHLPLVMLIVCSILGTTDAWAATTYGKVNVVAVGGGYVNVGTSTLNTASESSKGITINGKSTNYIITTTYSTIKTYFYAVPQDGYYFVGWFTDASCSTSKNTNASWEESFQPKGSSSSPTNHGTFYAKFSPVTATLKNGVYTTLEKGKTTASATFATVGADNINDFETPSITKKTGDGSFSNATFASLASNTLTVNYTFNSNGVTGEHTADLTFATANGGEPKTHTVQVRVAGLANEAEGTGVATENLTQVVNGTATIETEYVTAQSQIKAPTITNLSGTGDITMTSWSWENNQITINYSFDPQGTEGSTTADLNISLNATTGDSKTYQLMATATAPVAYEAEVEVENEIVKTGTWTECLVYANTLSTNPTLRLRNNVSGITAKQSITKSMTLDLNSQTISGTMTTADGMLDVNGTGIVVTITDNSAKKEGKISNVSNAKKNLYAVYVTKGTLNFEEGYVHSENTYGTASSDYRAIGIGTAAGTTLNVTGGIIEGVSTKDYANGIYSYGTTNISGGEIIGTGYNTARGIVIYNGTTTMTGGTMTVTSTGTTDATGVYMSSSAAGVFNLNGGEIICNAKTTTARGIYMGVAKAAVNVSGGTVTATSQTNTAYGYMDDKGGAFTISGGTIHGIACGTNLTAAGSLNAYGAYISAAPTKADFIDGTIIGECTKASYGRYGYGLYTTKSLTIDGNCTFKGITAYQYGYGIQVAGGTTTFKNGNVLGQAATNARGIVVSGNTAGTIVLNMIGGNISAQTTSSTYAYGVNGAGIINIHGGNINATAATTNAYGIYVDASPNATDGKSYHGKLIMDGGDIVVRSAGSAYGINIVGSSTTAPAATDGTYSNKASSEAVITGGSIDVVSSARYAYGVWTRGGINSKIYDGYDLTSMEDVKTVVKNIPINVTATQDAYGVYAAAAVEDLNGAIEYGIAELENLTVTATTTSAATAYGAFVQATHRTMNEGTYVSVKADNKKTWYTDNTPATSTQTYRYNFGEFACAAKMKIKGGTYTANSATTTAYGACTSTRAKSYPGNAEAYPVLDIDGGTFIGNSTTTTAAGLSVGGYVTVKGGTFKGFAKTDTGFGVRSTAGTLNMTGSTIETSATTKAYGVYASAAADDLTGFTYGGSIELTDCDVTASTTSTTIAYGLYAHAAGRSMTPTTYTSVSDDNKKNWYSDETAATVGQSYRYNYGDFAAGSSIVFNSGSVSATAKTTTAYAAYSISATYGLSRSIGSITIRDGKFNASGTGTYQDVLSTGDMLVEGGYFVQSNGVADCTPEGRHIYPLKNDHPMYSEGYRYEIDDLRYGTSVCKNTNGGKEYLTLEAALEDVNNGTVNGGTIVMLLPYTLPAGNYKIPNGTTLLVPYKSGSGKGADQAIGTQADVTTPASVSAAVKPYNYRTLTLSEGVHIDVYGVIEVSAQMFDYTTSTGTSIVYGPYGQIHMEEGSSMSLEDGARLQAWGYVTGKGETTARRGSTVYEMFQVYDWKGGSELTTHLTLKNSQHVFQVNQYYIQNVESPVIYRPGSHLKTNMYTSIQRSLWDKTQTTTGCEIGIIGEWRSDSDKDIAMFLMNTALVDDDTWVRKEYDAENDVQLYTINSSAFISAMELNVKAVGQDLQINSADYDLPLTNNFKVIINSGTLNITEDVVMLPGSEIEVKKEAVLNIYANKRLVLYDADEWGKFAYSKTYSKTTGFSPSWTMCPRMTTKAAMKDAEIDVRASGKILVNGYIYTTNGGANIHSSNADAGYVVFPASSAAPTNKKVYQWWKGAGETQDQAEYVGEDVLSAQLANEDGTFTATTTAYNGKSYAYSDGRWQCWEQVGCYQVDKTNDTNWKWYANPSDFVQLKSNETNNHEAPVMDEDHLFPNTDETRFFILMDDNCIWWEVSLVDDNLCYSEMNDTYYQWDGSKWVITSFVITWKDWNGTTLDTYNNVKYRSMPKWLSATPTKPKQPGDPAGSYYIFSGWTPDLNIVTENATYTATYELIVPKYDVLWKNEDGSKTLHISRWAEGEHPAYDGAEIKKATSMEGVDLAHNGWSTAANGAGTRYGLTDELPAMGAAAQTYYATFAEGYIITWKNEDGTVLDRKLWATGTRPTHADINKESDAQYDYVFAGWTPEILPVEADAEYTAVFTPVLRQYAITFSNLNGKGSSQVVNVNYGATPVCPVTPDRGNSAEYSYEWTGWKDAAGNTYGTDYVFPAVSGDATYTATFSQTTRTYTVTWKNEDGSVLERVRGLAVGDAVPDYSGATPEKEPTRYLTYGFAGWTPAKKATIDESGDQEYRATFDAGTTRYYTIRWLMDNGDLIDETNLEYDEMPTHADPTKASNEFYSYDFAGWTPVVSAVKGDAEYKATFNAIHRQYEITYILYDDVKNVVRYEADAVVTIPADPTREGYTFAGWLDEIPETMPAKDIIIRASWTEIPLSADIVATSAVTVTENTKVNNLTISETGSVTIDDAASVTVVNNLLLEATPDNNLGAVLSGNIQVKGNAFIDINMNGSGTMNKNYYYSFAVPFSVNVNDGVFRMENGNAVPMAPGVGFLAYKYNEATRATMGADDSAWESVNSGTFEPGVFYLILFSSNKSNTYRFQWNGNGSVNNHADISVTTTGNDATNSGWHGVANNGLGYTKMTGEFTVMQTLNSEDNVFESFTITDPIAMANPVFVQMASGTIDLSTPTVKATAAPRRAAAVEKTELMNVRLTREGADKHDDQIFFSASEEAEDQYTLGKDVAKMFMGTAKTAQLWINAYGERLVANEMTMTGNTASADLSFYAPAAASYLLHLKDIPADTRVYLTNEGMVVWDLSMSDYMLDLSAGTNEGYGLLITKNRISTGMEDATIDACHQTKKVLINHVLYIIRNGRVYDANGKEIKR